MLNEQEMARSKELLDDFYNLQAVIDKMAVADALDKLKLVAENMVDFIVDLRFPE
jgi:hypothetical protein